MLDRLHRLEHVGLGFGDRRLRALHLGSSAVYGVVRLHLELLALELAQQRLLILRRDLAPALRLLRAA